MKRRNRQRGTKEQRAQLRDVLNAASAMTTAKQEPRRHHLVPRFYLEQWAVDGRVQVTDLLQQRRTFQLRPEHALVETDFYRINEGMVDGGSPVAWETWLSAIEGAAAPLLPVVRDEGLHTLEPELQGQFLQFLAVQVTRSRTWRYQGRWMLGAGYFQMWELGKPGAIAAHLKRNGTEPTAERVANLQAYFDRVNADPWAAARSPELEMEASMHAGNALIPSFVERVPVTFRSDAPLLTSDEPVTLLTEHHGDLDSPHVGFHAAPIIAVPLGPHHVLALFRRDLPAVDVNRCLSRSDTLELNRALLGNAHRHVVSLPGNQLAERLYVPDLKPPMRLRNVRSEGRPLLQSTPQYRWSGERDAPQRPVSFLVAGDATATTARAKSARRVGSGTSAVRRGIAGTSYPCHRSVDACGPGRSEGKIGWAASAHELTSTEGPTRCQLTTSLSSVPTSHRPARDVWSATSRIRGGCICVVARRAGM